MSFSRPTVFCAFASPDVPRRAVPKRSRRDPLNQARVCCSSMIMSPFHLDRNVPLFDLPMRRLNLGRSEMSDRELGRVEVLARVKSGELRVVDGAELMRVSYRQGKRLWKRYREEGAAGLKHRSAGRPSNRAYGEEQKRTVLGLVREKYGGRVGERFGPTLAAEHLASEDGQRVDAETLRRWMRAEGLWSRERERRRHRRRREPKEHFGAMVQMDGSFHAWLEERGPRGCLMDLVDDATGTTLARLGEEETIWAAAGAL